MARRAHRRRTIHEALGEHRFNLLTHHGMPTATVRIEASTQLAAFFERAARMQILASCAGEIRRITAELAREAHDYRLRPKAPATFHYFAQRVLKREGEEVLG